MIYLAADHGGFKVKEELKKEFDSAGISYTDMGAFTLDTTDDYPDFAIPTAKKISENPRNKAILMCRSGVGEVITANKFKNVRASLSWNKEHAKKSREDDDTNVLAIPSDYLTIDQIKDIVVTWLNTDFSKAERHVRRLSKIAEIDK